MTNKILILLTLFALVSCGGMTKNEDEDFVEQEDNIEVVNDEEDADDVVVLDENVENSEEPSEEIASTNTVPEGDSGSAPMAEQGMNSNGDIEYGEHTVSNGETLGVIASKIYGDFRKWRSIYLDNEEKLGAKPLTAGTILRYQMPAEGEVIRPEGNPYLILRNDTLGTISEKVYDGTTNHWKKIWKNNHQMIWDPNLIFAGLTIFTPELNSEREVANKL